MRKQSSESSSSARAPYQPTIPRSFLVEFLHERGFAVLFFDDCCHLLATRILIMFTLMALKPNPYSRIATIGQI
jgi:hypothetical protein